MKYLQGYNNFIIKESLSEDELNQILDKISKSGVDSLTDIEKRKLNNYGNDSFDIKQEIINEITSIIGEKYITTMELDVESSPIYIETDDEIHLIERMDKEAVDIVVYDKNDSLESTMEYDLKFSELDLETLVEIKEMLETAKKEKII
jgi:hypothetical protein